MAGLAEDLKVVSRIIGQGFIWAGVTIPASGSRIAVAANANGIITPDATANPNAFPIGATKGGVKLSLKKSSKDINVDEIAAAVDSILEQVEMSLNAEIVALTDEKVVKLALSGIGTSATSTGIIENKIGFATETFSGICFIAPMREDPTKVFVFHIYKAKNSEGLDFSAMRTDMASSAVNFKGYAVTTRPKDDQLGNYWWQTA